MGIRDVVTCQLSWRITSATTALPGKSQLGHSTLWVFRFNPTMHVSLLDRSPLHCSPCDGSPRRSFSADSRVKNTTASMGKKQLLTGVVTRDLFGSVPSRHVLGLDINNNSTGYTVLDTHGNLSPPNKLFFQFSLMSCCNNNLCFLLSLSLSASSFFSPFSSSFSWTTPRQSYWMWNYWNKRAAQHLW